MSTSGAGFGASGFLQGFAQTYNAARVRATQQDLEQRHQMAGTLATLYPNARPEAQADIAQRILQIYSTPPGKKLDKKIGDISTLGRAAAQQGMQQGAQEAGANVNAGQTAAFGGAAPAPSGGGIPAPPGTGAAPPTVEGAPGPTGGMALGGAPRIPAPPDLSQPSAGYSPILSPAERNAQAAATISVTKRAELTAELDARRKAAEEAGLHPGTPGYENFVAGRMVTPFAHFQQKMYVNPNDPNGQPVAGFFDPLTSTVTDANGEVMSNPIPWVATQNGQSRWLTMLRAGRQAGLSDAEIVNNYNTTYSSSSGIRMVTQKDGTIEAVPVTTTTERQRGQIPAPPGSGTPQPKRVGQGSSVGTGTVVGGKVPPEVAKAQTTYQTSVSRYNVMSEALPDALAGNQQAMINLLYNHIGMTTGLQKGGRITQPIIDEAATSAPWISTLLARIGVGNEFTMTPELLRGVALTPDMMHQMVGLAESRVEQDWRDFQQQQTFYQSGAGAVQPPESVIAGGRKAQGGKAGTPSAKVPPPPSTPKPAASSSSTSSTSAKPSSEDDIVNALIKKHTQPSRAAVPAPPQ